MWCEPRSPIPEMSFAITTWCRTRLDLHTGTGDGGGLQKLPIPGDPNFVAGPSAVEFQFNQEGVSDAAAVAKAKSSPGLVQVNQDSASESPAPKAKSKKKAAKDSNKDSKDSKDKDKDDEGHTNKTSEEPTEEGEQYACWKRLGLIRK